MPFELFHEVAQADSARARRYVVEHRLEETVRFRNIFYPEVKTDFAARGGTTLPALWDGAQLVEGIDAIIARLSR